MLKLLNGYKSYLGGGAMILTGVLGLFGIGTGTDGTTALTPGECITLISGGWALISLKSAVAKV